VIASFYFKEAFMMVSDLVWQDVMDKKLSGTTLRVFAFLASRVKMNNRFEGTQQGVADLMGLAAPAVNKAFRELREAGYIIRITEPTGAKFWQLDARRVFRGSAKRHKGVVERQRKAAAKADAKRVVSADEDDGPQTMTAADAAKFEQNFRRARLELEAEALLA
jgi:hypothetical protein